MNEITGFYRENGIYSICPRCKNRIKLSVETMFFATKLSEKITCIDCDAELILKIELLDRAAELPLEPTTGQDFSSVASDEIKIQIRLGRNNHLVREETCPRNAGRINIYLPDNIEEIENSEKS